MVLFGAPPPHPPRLLIRILTDLFYLFSSPSNEAIIIATTCTTPIIGHSYQWLLCRLSFSVLFFTYAHTCVAVCSSVCTVCTRKSIIPFKNQNC